MKHRGVEYSVVPATSPGIWKWQFRIGDRIKTGKTQTRLQLLAIRRAQIRIDQELRKAAGAKTPSTTGLRLGQHRNSLEEAPGSG